MQYSDLFETIIETKQFDKYENKLSVDDYNDLLNDICYTILKLQTK